MFHLSRALKIFFALAVIVVGGYLLSRDGLSSDVVTVEFKDARLEGALIAQDIVTLSNRLMEDLGKVNQLDKEGKFEEALGLTTALIERSGEVRGKAIELSNRLEKMTRALSAIKSPEAREAAFASISNRLVIINRLVNYSDYLAQLLNALRNRFAGVSGNYGIQVTNLINTINAEVASINDFNAQAGQAMERFDAIISNQ